MNNRKKIIMLLTSLLLIIIISSIGTYAWFRWRNTLDETVNINLTATSVISFYGGTDIVGGLQPVLNKEDGILKKIKVIAETSGNQFNLYMKINSLPVELKSTSFLWAIYKGSQYISGNNFSTYNNNDNILLINNAQISSDDIDEYNIYFWIDGSVANNSNMENKTIRLSLYATGESGIINEIQE